MTNVNGTKFYNAVEAGQLLGFCSLTIKRLIKRGLLSGHRSGYTKYARYRISEDDIRQFQTSSQIQGNRDRVYTARQFARLIGYSHQQVINMINAGEIQTTRPRKKFAQYQIAESELKRMQKKIAQPNTVM